MEIKIKPLSVNKCWQGRRFRTPEYRAYKDELQLKLKPMEIPEGPLEISFMFGVSNMAMDWDNAIKPTQDVICDYYGFNDSRIIKGEATKVKTKKGEEFINFEVREHAQSK